MEAMNNLRVENTLQEMCKVLENMPEERRAYLNGYAAGMLDERKLNTQGMAMAAAGMNAEHKLSAQQKPA